ncbi:MAG: Lrp/AsnC family transcriptional regulator [Ruminococcaceae bacterium]|nr:Lrp/AsnC family transcriptional regulator [Oscillospiraceae bacterium]
MDKLISLLYEDSSLSVDELAAMLGESEEDIQKRINEYKKSGVILGKKTFINWDKVENSGVTAIIELKVTPQKETGFDEIAARISEFDEVDTVHLMAADNYDLSVTVRGKTIQDVAMFVSRRLATIDAVQSTATHFLLKRYKENGVQLTVGEKDQRSMML